MNLQRILESLQRDDRDADWDGRPNQWVKGLSPVALSHISVNLVAKALGGRATNPRSSGYKVRAGDIYADVKSATLSRNNGCPSLSWRNMSLSEPWSHVALVAYFPDTVRVFLVPGEQIGSLPVVLVKGTHDNYQLVTTSAFDLPQALVGFEIGGAP